MRKKGDGGVGDRIASNRMVDLLSEEFMYGTGDGGWQKNAACRERDDLDPMSQDEDAKKRMQKVCGVCEVRDECLSYAQEKEVSSGIWGGVDLDPSDDDRPGA